MKKFLLLKIAVVAMLLPLTARAQDTVYFCDFDHPSDTAGWIFVNGTEPNYWEMGTATNMSSGGLYVTNDGSTNAYDDTSFSVTYVYKEVTLPRGAYHVSYDWRCMGGYNAFMRFFLTPDTVQLVAGMPPEGSNPSYYHPIGYIPLDGGHYLCLSSSWLTHEEDFIVTEEGGYRLLLLWFNNGYNYGVNPPAAVDNLLITRHRCPEPIWLYADSISATSFTLHWSDLSEDLEPGLESNTSQWLVELDSATQTYGQGTQYTTNDTLITFTGLTPNTEYRVYVRAECFPEPESMYSDTTDTVSLRVRTGCSPISSLPYMEDFGAATSLNQNVPFCWQILAGEGSIYMTSRKLGWFLSRPPYRYLLLPAIDATAIPIDGIQLSMRGVAQYEGVSFDVGIMTDPTDTASFVLVDRVDVFSTEWEQYVVDFSNIQITNQDSQLVYIAIRPTYAPFGYQSGIVQFDDFMIDYATCQQVRNLAVRQVGTTGAQVGWTLCYGHLPEPDGYDVRVESIGSSSIPTPTAPPDSCRTIACVEPRCLLTGLEPNTIYRVWVRVQCDSGNYSVWDTVSLTTLRLPCLESDTTSADTVPLGTGVYQVTGVPVSYIFTHSLCQSVYTADELLAAGMGAGPIGGMDYTFTSSPHDMYFSIYMSTTTHDGYVNQWNMDSVHEQDLVYGPSLHPNGTVGTVHYAFDTPFEWDGESNIVVTTIMNGVTAEPLSSMFYGFSTRTGTNCTLYGYLNDQPFTTANIMLGSYNTSQYRPSVAFHYMMSCSVEAECAPPTIVVGQVETDGAYVEWIPGNQESSWDVLYRLSVDTASVMTDTGWTVADTNVNTNHYHLINLEPGSDYEVRVVPRCDSAQNDSLFAQAFFTTTTVCASIGVLPWTTSFEDFEVPSEIRHYNSCWYGGGNYWGDSYPRIVSTYAHSGSASLYLYHQNSYYGQSYMVLPPVDMRADSLQVHFYTYADRDEDGSSYQLYVGVMDDPEDITTFQPVAMVTPSESAVWEENEIPLDSYTGIGRYITLAAAGLRSRVHVDDLAVEYIPSCQRPRNVTVEAVTRSTAVVQWDGRRVRNYEVEYGPSGFEPGTGSVVATVLDSVTLTGLTHSTIYDLYVRGICDPAPGEGLNDTSVRSFVTTFSTVCGEIDTLPYVQNFSNQGEGDIVRPLCWTCGGYNDYPYIVRSVDDRGRPHGHSLYMVSLSNRAYAILPAVDTLRYPITSLQVLVEAHCFSSTDHNMVVGVCQTEGDITSFTPVDTIVPTPVPTVYEVSLSNAWGLGNYITFVSRSMGGGLYLDSVVVMPIPSCQVPCDLVASSLSTTTADLLWQPRGTVSWWQVEYMPHDVPLGMGTRVIATTPSLTLTGLTPNTSYDFYVRGLCDSGDTSEWCYAPGHFSTYQIPAMVPYFYGCDSASEWDNWQTLANGSVGWYHGMADGQPAPSIYISADSGATRSALTNRIVNTVAYRDIDFGTIDTSFVLSFSAAVSSYRNTGGLAVFLADPATPLASIYDVAGRSPWGRIDTLPLIADIRGTTEWTDYSVTLDSIHGIHRLVFYGYEERPSTGTSVAIDNISIQYPPCQRPYSVRAIGVTAVSATVLWHGPATADYHVSLYNTAGTLLANDTVHTNRIQYLTLFPSNTYKVRVGRLCDGSEIRQPAIYSFSTPACMDGYVDTIGSPTDSVSATDVPFNICYPYSYTQQIIRASELMGRGEITAINFLYDSPYSIFGKTNCTIYLGHTSMTSFPTTNHFVQPTDLESVYIGPLNCSQGWNRILLGSPYPYDGTSNLVIAIDDNSNGTHYSIHHFAATATVDPMSISFYGYDNVDCSSNSALTLYDGGKSVRFYRSVISLEMCPPNDCQPPHLFAPRVRANDVTVRWRGSGQAQGRPQRFLFGYRRADSDSWIVDNLLVTDTVYTIDRFFYDEDYVYHVRQYCDTVSVSNWALGSFNTAVIPCLPPERLYVTDATNHSVHLEWTPDDNHISYHLHVWGSGIDTTLTTYIANAMVDGLNPASHYYASVEVQCEYLDQPSEWSDTITFETARCPDVTEINALEVYGNSVLLDWDEPEPGDATGGQPQSWQIEWGLQGFDHGTGITVTADHHPFLLTGLTGETSYDILVRAVCGDDYVSEGWSPRLTITTAYSGIETDEILNSQFSIYPNPTTGDVTLSVSHSSILNSLRVEIIDMTGRQCLNVAKGIENGELKIENHPGAAANSQFAVVLSTSQLPAGAYFVRLTTDRISVVRKLIVNK